MKQRYFRFLIFFIAVFAAGLFFVHSIEAAQLNTGLNFATGTGLSNQDIRITIAKIIRIILGFLGIIAVGLTLYAGFLWMTSGGNEDKLAQAKLILRNGIIGLIIILASFGIVSFILGRLMSATGGSGGENGNGNGNGGGIGSLGNGIVKSVYPEPFQTNVPRNTSIIVTFREPILASSICVDVTNNLCAPGTKIKTTSVNIYNTLPPIVNVTDVFATSTDNKTFVFKPVSPIGSPNGNVNYTVKLTQDIKKADGSNAFKLSDFYWTFETNNLLDLISPKIKSITDGGIFPLPDNEADVVSGTEEATPATGAITVNGTPSTYQAASAGIQRLTPPINPPEATISGTNNCKDGNIIATIVVGNKVNLHYSQSGLISGDVAIVNNKVDINPCGLSLTLTTAVVGTQWRIDVVSEKTSDTLTVGSKTYSFVSSNPSLDPTKIIAVANVATTASNIAAAINDINPDVTSPSVNGAVVNVRAKVAGVLGNSIELSSSNNVALGFGAGMHGGTDKTTTYTIKDKPDQPKNTVIQINFNEAVNPLMVSGTSEELADKFKIVNADSAAKANTETCNKDSDCRSYKCVSGVCQGDQLAGSFMVSNQYKTVEFISDTKCGVNGCGENIYCLPANSNLKVEMKAASLKACTSNTDCTFMPYSTCTQGVCEDLTNHKNYPTAPSLNGVVDLADNSLDGNRNDNPQGQADFYDENKTPKDNADRGDNYLLSFWISDRLDLTPPNLTSLDVNNNASQVNLTQAIEIVFSKIMMSSSLATGTVTVNNGTKDIVHKLINLWSLANDPIGYWISKQDVDVAPFDGQPDRTKAYLNHGSFSDSTYYESQVGSGVKDIYQNCYKPSSGPSCLANPLQPSCCRNEDQGGVLTPTTNLTPEGNCPQVINQ